MSCSLQGSCRVWRSQQRRQTPAWIPVSTLPPALLPPAGEGGTEPRVGGPRTPLSFDQVLAVKTVGEFNVSAWLGTTIPTAPKVSSLVTVRPVR